MATETVSKLFVDEITVALEARETLCDSNTQGTNSNLIPGAIYLNFGIIWKGSKNSYRPDILSQMKIDVD